MNFDETKLVDKFTVDEPVQKQRKRYHLFRFKNNKDELLYVSQNPNFVLLMRNKWFEDINDIKVEHFNTAGELADAKAVAIDSESPKHNSHGRRITND